MSTLAHRLTVIHLAQSGLASNAWTTLNVSEQSSLGSAAPHPASGVTSAHQLTHLVADWHQSTCWVGLVKTKFVDPNTYQLPCKNHLDKKNRKHTNASYSPTTAVKVADLGRFGAGGHCEEVVDNQRHEHLIVPRILPVANKHEPKHVKLEFSKFKLEIQKLNLV